MRSFSVSGLGTMFSFCSLVTWKPWKLGRVVVSRDVILKLEKVHTYIASKLKNKNLNILWQTIHIYLKILIKSITRILTRVKKWWQFDVNLPNQKSIIWEKKCQLFHPSLAKKFGFRSKMEMLLRTKCNRNVATFWQS